MVQATEQRWKDDRNAPGGKENRWNERCELRQKETDSLS